MKLAQALLLKSDMQKKFASLRERIARNAVVQMGDEPHEDPHKLIEEAFGVLKEIGLLAVRINKTNLRTALPDGRSLSEAIAHRDTMTLQHSLIQHANSSTQREPRRYGVAEIKWVATLRVASLQKQSDDLAKKIRELNSIIQETNWTAELEE
jgi:hypothetical protein